MAMAPRSIAVCAALVALASGHASTGPGTAAIVGGTHAAEYTSVVYLFREAIECTGTLVGGRLLVTAAHCVPATPERRVFVTNEALGPQRRTAACVQHKHYNDHSPYFDLAVCEIEGDLADVPVETLGAATPGFQAVTYVGYGPMAVPLPGTPGASGTTPPRTKGEGSLSSAKEATLLLEGPGTLSGDSGGPVFLGTGASRGPLVGVLSCSSGPERAPRAVDLTDPANKRWLRACMADFAACRGMTRRPRTVTADPDAPLCGG